MNPRPPRKPTDSAPPRGTSAPAFGAAVSRIAPMLGVRPDKNREPDMSLVLPFVHEDAKH